MAVLVQLLDDVVIHKFELQGAQVLVGRKPGSDIIIDDSAVSSSHACITLQANPYFAEYLEAYLEDLNSTNGTTLNGQSVVGKQRLRHNDVIKFAWNTFKFIDESEEQMEKTVQMLRTQSSQ